MDIERQLLALRIGGTNPNISHEIFLNPFHREIWRKIEDEYKGKDISLPELETILTSDEYLYLKNLEPGDITKLSSYVNILKNEHSKRVRSGIIDQMKIAVLDGKPLGRYIKELEEWTPGGIKSPQEIINSALSNIKTGFSVIKTGLPYIDNSAKGLSRGELSVLAGRPGNGKSSLAINIAKSLIERDFKVAFFSREMTKEALMSKIVANELRINSHRFRGNIDNKLKTLIDETQETFSNNLKNLLIIDDVWALDETINIIKDYKPDVFVDDYIQLAKGSPLQEKRFEIEEILLEYKRSCKLLNCHGIIISQMNREIEKRLTFTPMMSDLAESAALEHAAELLAFILYPHVNNPSMESPHRSLLFIKKSRYGQVGTYEFGYRGEFCKYYDSVEEAANDSPRDY